MDSSRRRNLPLDELREAEGESDFQTIQFLSATFDPMSTPETLLNRVEGFAAGRQPARERIDDRPDKSEYQEALKRNAERVFGAAYKDMRQRLIAALEGTAERITASALGYIQDHEAKTGRKPDSVPLTAEEWQIVRDANPYMNPDPKNDRAEMYGILVRLDDQASLVRDSMGRNL